MTDCIFCREAKQGINIFTEDDLFYVRWDQVPLQPGHMLVIPKRHVQFLSELDPTELGRILPLAHKVAGRIKNIDSFAEEYRKQLETCNDFVRPHLEKMLAKSQSITSPPVAFNYGINDGPIAGQSVPHVHLHIIPRWEGDVENPKGGIRRMFGKDEYSDE